MRPAMFVAIAGLILIGYLSTLAFKLIITKMGRKTSAVYVWKLDPAFRYFRNEGREVKWVFLLL